MQQLRVSLSILTFVTRSDKTSLIARKYTRPYNGIYLLFCVCYSNSVSFITFLRIYCIHDGKVCAKILCSGKVLLIFKTQKIFKAIRLVLSERVTFMHISWKVLKHLYGHFILSMLQKVIQTQQYII